MIETFYNQDINNPVKVQYLDGNVFSLDNNGNKIGVKLYNKTTPVDVVGTISANVIRADGATVAVAGSSSGNSAWVILPQSAYAVPGLVSVIIKATNGSDITTLCAVVGNVYASSTDSTVDPGTIIPSIETLIAAIDAAVSSIPADYSTLSNTVFIASESIESDFENAVGTRALVFKQGKYATPSTTIIGETATYVDDSACCCAICPCVEGDTFTATINGPTGKQRAWFFCDSTMTVLSRAAANLSLANEKITAPANAAFVTFTNALSARSTGYYAYKGSNIIDRAITSGGTVAASSISNDIDNAPMNQIITITGASATASAHAPFSAAFYLLTYASFPGSTASGVQVAIPYTETSPTIAAIRKRNSSGVFSDWMYIPKTIITEPISTVSEGNDHTSVIQERLNTYGFCQLGKGNYFVTNLTMPTGSVLAGFGNSTTLFMKGTADGAAITLGDRCTVRDMSIVGDSYDLSLDGHFIMSPVSDDNVANQWQDGTVQISNASGFVHMVLTNPIPAGTYHMTALAQPGDSEVKNCYIGFSTSQTGDIGTSNIIYYTTFNANQTQQKWFTLTETCYSVRICAAHSAGQSAGHTAVWSNIAIRATGNRSGIAWNNSGAQYGRIENCNIYRFNCAGIIAYDTGSPSNHNIMVENCTLYGNNVGFYIRNNSEFNKISNCTITNNYFGILNRGGNNIISNCGIDSNKIGIQIDEDNSSNAGHGGISNCTINHSDNNTGYGLIIRDTGRMAVGNCNLFYSKVRLQNTNGNMITGCQFGNNGAIEITGGACNVVNGCVFVTATETPIAAYNNVTSKAVNCFKRNGDTVTITQSDTPI